MQFAGLHVKSFAQKHNHWLSSARATSTKGQRHCTGLRGALLAARTMGGPLQSSAQVGRVSAEAQPDITGKVEIWLKQVFLRLTPRWEHM